MDDYSKLSASDGTGEAVVANVETDRLSGATTLNVDNVDNWPTNFICVTGTLNPNNYIDNSSMSIFYGHLDAGNIIIDSFAPGYTDVGNTAGQIAIIKPTTEWVNQVVELARVSHKDDGSIKTAAVATALNAPQGFLINGKISRSVASNNLTVAIKTLAGTDPSATDPVYVRIGDSLRSITAALSITVNAGTNWWGMGASFFAATDNDYFAYLIWNTVTSAVSIAVAREPDMRIYSDRNATSTNHGYLVANGTAPNATDEMEVIGRFNAILGVSASYNWSVPGTSIIINRPIFETRVLSYTNTGSGGGTAFYQQEGSKKRIWGESASLTTTGVGPKNFVYSFPTGYYATVQHIDITTSAVTTYAEQYSHAGAGYTTNQFTSYIVNAGGASAATAKQMYAVDGS